MSLFDVLSKGFCSKKRESNEILSQEEYKDKFLHGDDYIKRELYDEYISRRLSEEFGLKYNEYSGRFQNVITSDDLFK